MTSSKLFRFLSSLSSEELRSFRKFLESPYFNTNEILVNLFNWLRPHYPNFTNSKLTKENCFRKLYPKEKKFTLSKVNDNLSKLTKLAEQFMTHESVRSSEEKFNTLLVETLGERQLFADFKKATQKVTLPISSINITDWQQHYKQLSVMLNYYHHPETYQAELDSSYLEKIDYHIDELYNLLKLGIGYEILSSKIIKGESSELDLPLSVQRIIASQKNTSNLEVKIFIDLITTHFHTNPKEILDKIVKNFSIEPNPLTEKDRITLFIYILNQGIALNRRNVISRLELLHLYQIGLEKKYLLVNGQIPDVTYTNIALLFCAEAIDSAEGFIEEYKILIPEEQREAAYIFASGYLLYHQGKYSECIQKLKDVKFPKRAYSSRVKSIIIRSWFELFLSGKNVYISLKSHIDTFDRFLRRKEDLQSDVTDGYLNFLSLLKKIIKLIQEKRFNENKDDLTKRVKLTAPLILRDWLLKILEEDISD